MKTTWTQDDLVISESEHKKTTYHLRIIGDAGPRFDGNCPPALCGSLLKSDIKTPVDLWQVDKPKRRYCETCKTLAINKGYDLR